MKARRNLFRRAFSLLELAAVLAIVALLATASLTRFGQSTIANGHGEGYARKLALSLTHARRATIATGDNHYLQWHTSDEGINGYTVMRRTSGGNIAVDQPRSVPQEVSVSVSHMTMEFDFDGTALSGYSIGINGPDRSWNVTVATLTGSAQVFEAAGP